MLAFAVAVAAAAALAITVSEKLPPSLNLDYQFITLITVLGGFAFQWVREGRVRKWLEKDAATIAAKASADASQLAAKTHADAQEVSAQLIARAAETLARLNESAEKVAAKVESSTATAEGAARGAEKAYVEANGVNAKIAELSNEIKAQNAQILALHQKIDEGTDSTNGKVHDEALVLAKALSKFVLRKPARHRK